MHLSRLTPLLLLFLSTHSIYANASQSSSLSTKITPPPSSSSPFDRFHESVNTLLLDQYTIRKSEQISPEILRLKKELATNIANFLESGEASEEEPVYGGMTESSSNCGKLLNTWMAHCTVRL